MCKPGVPFNVVIPAHKTLASGTLRQCIRAAGVTEDQIVAALG